MALVDIVLPIFLVIGLGLALRRLGLLGEAMNAGLSRLVFYVAAPALLLRSTAQGHFDWGARLPALGTVVGLTALVAAASYAAVARAAPARRGVLAQGCFRSNTVFIGLPLVLSAYGDAAPGPASVLIAIMVVVENLFSVVVLTLPHRQRHPLDPALWGRTALRIAWNPLILACAAGILYSLAGAPLPASLDRSLALLGSPAAPFGLLCVGAGLEFGRLRPALRATAWVSLVRLVLHPALVYLALHRLGLRGVELGVPVLVMACPTAVVSYIMAREMEGDAPLAGAIILGTTALSLATLVGWLALLGPG
jgi:predicted permease